MTICYAIANKFNSSQTGTLVASMYMIHNAVVSNTVTELPALMVVHGLFKHTTMSYSCHKTDH